MNQSLWRVGVILFLISLTAGCDESGGRPYVTQEVSYRNGDIRLSGRLYIPNGEGPFPAVALVHDSDKHSKDSYQEYSEHFAVNGIAVLNYDKRGVGGSTGEFLRADFNDLSGDALAGVAFLKSKPFVNRNRIGLLGNGEGGWINLIADQFSNDVAFLINVSGPAVTPGSQRKFAFVNELREAGHPESTIEIFSDLHQRLLGYFKTGQNREELLSSIEHSMRDAGCRRAFKENFLEDWIRMAQDENLPSIDRIKTDPWMRSYDLDPMPYYQSSRTPVLVIYGGRDHLVNVEESRRALDPIFEGGGNGASRVVVYPNADHEIRVMRRPNFLASPGFPDGYLESLTNWIK